MAASISSSVTIARRSSEFLPTSSANSSMSPASPSARVISWGTGTAHGDEYGAQRAELLEDLERRCPLAGNDVEILRRAHEWNRLTLGVLHREHEGGLVIGRRCVDRGAERGDAVALDVRRGGGDVERRRDRELARRVGDAEPVVAGRGGDHAPRAHVCGELGEGVVGAAELEGAGDLLALELEIDVDAGELGKRGGVPERGAARDAANAIGGGVDVLRAEVGERWF